MQWDIICKPSYSLLKVVLDPGESITAEPGAMVYMSHGVKVKTRTGGLRSALLRSLLGGESLFLNTFYAKEESEVWLSPSLPGDISYIELDGTKDLIIQDTSYLAHHGDVKISIAWRGFRGLIAEGELFWLKASGRGGVWVTSYGGIVVKELREGEKAIVDNFHFVAMDSTVRWRIRTFGGLKSFLLGGEGLVIEVEGPGRVFMQTRSLMPFLELIVKYIGRRK